jgi:hypothetical protein
MIECLGEDVLTSIPAVITQLLATSNLKDLMELIRLLNQLMAKFKVLNTFMLEIKCQFIHEFFVSTSMNCC